MQEARQDAGATGAGRAGAVGADAGVAGAGIAGAVGADAGMIGAGRTGAVGADAIRWNYHISASILNNEVIFRYTFVMFVPSRMVNSCTVNGRNEFIHFAILAPGRLHLCLGLLRYC